MSVKGSREAAVMRHKVMGYVIPGLTMDGEDWMGQGSQALEISADGAGNRHAIYLDITGETVLGAGALGSLTT